MTQLKFLWLKSLKLSCGQGNCSVNETVICLFLPCHLEVNLFSADGMILCVFFSHSYLKKHHITCNGNSSLRWHTSSLERKEKRLFSFDSKKIFPHQPLTDSAPTNTDSAPHNSQTEKSEQFIMNQMDSKEIWNPLLYIIIYCPVFVKVDCMSISLLFMYKLVCFKQPDM